MTWRTSALCAQTDLDLFFPEPGHSSNPAKAICARCPVCVDCLTLANSMAKCPDGIWAGHTETERQALKRTVPASYRAALLAPCGTAGGARRHRRRHEDLDEPCAVAERAYNRERRAVA